ncbi:MAG: hypothetical protein QW568_05110 [Candidatus Anstonellaceae archaeon]
MEMKKTQRTDSVLQQSIKTGEASKFNLKGARGQVALWMLTHRIERLKNSMDAALAAKIAAILYKEAGEKDAALLMFVNALLIFEHLGSSKGFKVRDHVVFCETEIRELMKYLKLDFAERESRPFVEPPRGA